MKKFFLILLSLIIVVFLIHVKFKTTTIGEYELFGKKGWIDCYFDQLILSNKVKCFHYCILPQYDEIIKLEILADPEFLVKKNGEYAVIDKNNNLLLDFEGYVDYEFLNVDNKHSFLKLINRDKKCGLYIAKGATQVPAIYDDITIENELNVIHKNGKKGFVISGYIVEPEYDSVEKIGTAVKVTKNGTSKLWYRGKFE